jgi:hypothetical protein
VEARELATSPWFGVGIGFCLLIFVFGFVMTEVLAATDKETWQGFVALAPWFAHPLVGMAVVAGHRAVTRAARDGADEVFAACPTDPAVRTVGFLLTAAVPVAALAVFLAVLGATTAMRSPRPHGPFGTDIVADLIATLVLGAGGVALGVAVGRWVRSGFAPVVAVVAVGFATSALNGVGGQGWNPLVQLSTAPTVEVPSPIFAVRPAFWHLLWVTGLTVAVAIGAVARHRRGPALALAAGATAAVVVVAGIGATRPLSDESAARIASLVASPAAHQDCTAVDGPVRVCVYPFHGQLLDRVTGRVGPVARVLPAGLGPLTLRQVYPDGLDELPPEVRRRIGGAELVRPAGEVPLGFEGRTEVIDDPGFDLALAALGLPLEPAGSLTPTVVAGQARGVVALWLATRGLGPADAARATTATEPGSPDPVDRGSLQSADSCRIFPLVWSAQDLAAARAVTARPEADVAAVVGRDWARWSDPRTGTDELLAALGLPGAGPFDRVEPRPGEPC